VTDPDSRAWHRLTPADQAALTDAGYPRSWDADEIIASQGGPPGSMYVIHSGWVKITVTNDRGELAPIAARGPGEIVGELAPIADRPRNATIQAITPVTALVIPQSRLRTVLSTRPHIAEELLRTAAIRLEQSAHLHLEAGGPDFPHRLAAVLVELAHQYAPANHNTQVILPFSQEDLASIARVSRSTLIRGLDRLRALSLIITSRGRVTIPHPHALHDFAAGRPLPEPPTDEP
jgi:CRP/FNR family transcriptional regulator, cyclic AMP receptor protein